MQRAGGSPSGKREAQGRAVIMAGTTKDERERSKMNHRDLEGDACCVQSENHAFPRTMSMLLAHSLLPFVPLRSTGLSVASTDLELLFPTCLSAPSWLQDQLPATPTWPPSLPTVALPSNS